MPFIKNKFTLNVVLIFSVFALITAYFIQYILNHKPCNLCLIERIPYLAAIIFISLIFILNKFEKIISLIVGLFFIFGAVVSFYHFGIEQGFFNESVVCDLGGSSKVTSTQDLLKQLEKETVSCKDVTFKVLGLSLATFNTVISIIISAIMFRIVINYEKNK
jgi:disulfide bond formation protein DsbB